VSWLELCPGDEAAGAEVRSVAVFALPGPRRAAFVWLQDGRCLLVDDRLYDLVPADASGWLARRGRLERAEALRQLRASGPESSACPVAGWLLSEGDARVIFDELEAPRLAFTATSR
jgi:hypothetical protein